MESLNPVHSGSPQGVRILRSLLAGWVWVPFQAYFSQLKRIIQEEKHPNPLYIRYFFLELDKPSSKVD